MKTLVATLGLLLAVSATAVAGVPQAISVQGVLRNGSGALQSAMINVQVNFYDAQTQGNLLSGEPLVMGAMAVNGLFSVTINDPALAGKLYASTTGQVWLELSVGNDTYPRQQVTSNIFALECSNAQSLGGVAASSYLTVTGNGGGLTNLNGANLQAGSVPRAALGSFITHSHGLTVSQGPIQNVNLINNGGTGGSSYQVCSACPTGTIVIGGGCFIQGTACGGAGPAASVNNNVWLKESLPMGNSYCCTGVAASGGMGICNLNVFSTCLGAATASAL